MTTVPYKEEYGKICFQESFEEELKGKSIEEQLRCFCRVYDTSSRPEIRGYGEHDYKDMPRYIKSVHLRFESSDGYTPTVRDGPVVGLAVKKHKFNETGEKEFHNEIYLPYECWCYERSSEEDGSGYKYVYRNKYLVCLSYGHDLW